ncbi:Cleavage and polyadenylation specificity factor subunit 2 [Trichinella sp. T9]|nr:Cleavage and polyadenylation specificity factor subunit 2 [Trichinella sp. T9]KRX61810.1 Cleavage and polyadenylation specificity factor subunit 2 [Trichinella sp. T9]
MTSLIRFEALSGVMDDSPPCYVLQVGEFHFMLDCGWDSSFNMDFIERAQKWAPRIDAVLLSYPDIAHIGALPYLVGKCGLSCPIYATVPVYRMGQMFLYDWYQSFQNYEDFQIFSLDDVDQVFDKVLQVKYNQQVSMKGRGHGLQIVPLPAGHMIGGTIWRITKMGEEEIVYAVDFNHKKERHLNGCLLESIARPNLLITDAYMCGTALLRRKFRDEALLSTILKTLRSGGNVLIVVDTAGRVLELVQLLDQLWHNAEAGLLLYSLIFMNSVAFNVVEFAKSQVEWMSERMLRMFEEGRNNPFQFRHAQLCHSLAELTRLRSPKVLSFRDAFFSDKVVLASQPDLDSGFSRELFLDWCIDAKNCIILTSRARIGSLCSKLIEMASSPERIGTKQITVQVKRRVRLEGHELDEFRVKKREQEQQATKLRLEQHRRRSRVDVVSLEDEDSDEEEKKSDATANEFPYDISYTAQGPDYWYNRAESYRRFPKYPHFEKRIKFDNYGEVIHAKSYLQLETKVRMVDLMRDRMGEDQENGVATPGEVHDIPTKCIQFVQTVEVFAQLEFIDFEGRTDVDSLKKILQMSKPKQIILVHGMAEQTEKLANYCRKSLNMAEDKVFTPRLGDLVDATIESHMYQLKLTDALLNSLKFVHVKDVEIAWVNGLIRHNCSEEETEDQKITAMDVDDEKNAENAVDIGSDDIPYLDLLPSSEIPSHDAVFVGDPKLSDLKQALMLDGFQAEFSHGVLVVNNVLSIRKRADGQLHVEGIVCKDYYAIRDQFHANYFFYICIVVLHSCLMVETEPRHVIVVGSGLAGLSAALAAFNQGSRVTILEGEPNIGGNSAKATSGINGCNTSTQRVNGVQDDAKLFFSDTMKAGHGINDMQLVDLLTKSSADAIDRLTEIGVDLSDLVILGGHSVRRTHRIPAKNGKPVPVGFHIVRTVHQHLLNKANSVGDDRLIVMTNVRAVSLITDADGSVVVGLRFEHADTKETGQLYADSIVLATGGYSNDHTSDSLLEEFAKSKIDYPTTNGPFAVGSGVKMARLIGAKLIDMDKVQVHPTGFVDPEQPDAGTKFLAAEALRGSGALLLDHSGQRFANELGPRDYLTGRIESQCKQSKDVGRKTAYMLLNDEAVDLFGRPSFEFYWKKKNFFTKADNVEQLAKLLNVEAELVNATLKQYAEAADGARDDPFGKTVFPVIFDPGRPIYVARITPVIHYTMGGLKIDIHSQVLREDGSKISGLYAAGEVSGGVHGANRLGGNSLLECAVFGAIAGKYAAMVPVGAQAGDL